MKFAVEHLEDELFPWSVLEYRHMLDNVGHGNLLITNVPVDSVNSPPPALEGAILTNKKFMELSDINRNRVALLDQCARGELQPEDAPLFDYILCGGILGCDEMEGPMVDRTAELREQGYQCRHLGSVQMTADTAVIVSKIIVEDGERLERLRFADKPSFRIRKKECIEMPFRYLMNAEGQPRIPDGMIDLWREDSF